MKKINFFIKNNNNIISVEEQDDFDDSVLMDIYEKKIIMIKTEFKTIFINPSDISAIEILNTNKMYEDDVLQEE